jgi:hypothetical protein
MDDGIETGCRHLIWQPQFAFRGSRQGRVFDQPVKIGHIQANGRLAKRFRQVLEISRAFGFYENSFHMKPQDVFHIFPERGEHVFAQF